MSELRPDAPAARAPPVPPRVLTGISGLDEVLRGGLPAGQTYLVTGNAGSGKTTLGLHFLMEGRARGERGLYLSLSETVEEIEEIARSHGWSLEGIDLREITADQPDEDETEQTVFKASEVELSEFRTRLETAVEQANPDRAVIDSLSELRLLAGDSRQHRKQVASLKRFFLKRGCTLLVTDDNTSEEPASLLHSLVHGVFALTRTTRAFGGTRRKLEVVKVRALAFSDGLHELSCRYGHPVSQLRTSWRSASGTVGPQASRGPTRAHPSRAHVDRRRHCDRQAAYRSSRCAHRYPSVKRFA